MYQNSVITEQGLGTGLGGRAITPQKLEHSLKGRKNIVKLAKDPPPPSKI